MTREELRAAVYQELHACMREHICDLLVQRGLSVCDQNLALLHAVADFGADVSVYVQAPGVEAGDLVASAMALRLQAGAARRQCIGAA